MFDVTRWWYKRGVSGFRLDAVDTLFEDPNLIDNPVKPGINAFGDRFEEKKYTRKLPEVHEALRGLRRVADEYNAVLIGETWTANIEELNAYYGHGNNELQLPMDFLFTTVNKLSPAISANRLPKSILLRVGLRSSSATTTSSALTIATAMANTTIRSQS